MIKRKPKSFTPMIVEESNENTSIISVYDKLLQNNIIFLGDEITDYLANTINAQLLYLDSINTNKKKNPIWLYINSPGGSIYDGLAIYDTINLIETPVYTCVIGLAASMAFVLACAGHKGHRYALKHSKLMMHQPLSGINFSQASDIEIHNKEVQLLKNDLIEIISKHTGVSTEKVKHDMDRDYWLTSTDALNYNVIDSIKIKI